MQIELASTDDPSRATLRCQLCDFTEIVTDRVYADAPLCLAACPRCDHRWTRVIAAHLPAARAPGLTRPRWLERRAVA